ncbi:MAG: hypothetical protein H7Y28_02470 [Rhodoferax sp.]|nr:hypothetical protein [Rhodoferax sp.]
MTIKLWILGAVALCVATGSDALTLGRARGAALLGQPLEVSVSVQSAADEALSTECFDAEVYYGENRQEAARVTVTVSETSPGQALSVKVTSRAAVDEPVVTVYLRGGCGQKTTRKYVLLADMTSEPAVVQVPTVLPTVRTASPAPEPKPVVAASPVQSSAASQNTDAPAGTKKPRTQPNASASTMRSSDRLAAYSPATPSVVKKPRLKLAAIDLTERDPVLRLSNELLSTPLEDLQKRAEAIATWRSLNQTTQDVLNEQARMQVVDADLKALREQMARNQTQLLELGGRLEKAESQRYANPLVYGLFLVLLVLVAGLVWAWRRLRQANVDPYPWWSGGTDSVHSEHGDSRSQSLVRETVASPNSRMDAQPTHSEKTVAYTAQAPAQRRGVSAVDIDIDVDLEMGPSVFAQVGRDDLPPLPAQPSMVATDGPKHDPGVRDFAHSVAGTLRAINSQELLDVRQQADFFMTLGQYEDAIHLLEADIKDNGESNPLVYLDLLKILHTLSRKDEFDRYRKEFNILFTGEVPEYITFNQSGNRLDQYPDVCKEISEAWNTTAALDVIEGYLVKSKNSAQQWHFDLEAYRDLLMLHGVAGRIDAASDSVLAPFSASKPAAAASVNHADGIHYDPTPSEASADTVSLPAIGGAPRDEFDLNLDSASQNLIDFEVSGFSHTGSPNTRKN